MVKMKAWVSLLIYVALFVLFNQVISVTKAQSNFTVQPVSVIQAEGLEAVFECLYPGATSYAWSFNGTFERFYPSDVRLDPRRNGSPASLTIPAIPKYNNTVVQCRASVEVGERPELRYSRNVKLKIYGPLESISNLQFGKESISSTSIPISWTAPFSLNLTNAEPDIQYCLDVYNITGGGDLVESICDITETFYTYTPDNPSPDHVFNFTVTPRSNVEGALNGTTSEPIQGSFCKKPSSIMVVFSSNINLDPMTITIRALDGPTICVPSNYSIELRPVQNVGDTSDQPIIECKADSTKTDNTTELTFNNLNCSSDIVRHELYYVTIKMTYNGGNAESDHENTISTHDVQAPDTSTFSQPGQINITSTYLDGTEDLGYLVLAYSLNVSEDFVYRAANRNGSESTAIALTNLQNGTYMIAVYDLESEAIPRGVPADIPKSVHIVNFGGPTPSNNNMGINQPKVTSTSDGKICIICPFSDPSTTGCVGIIHSADIEPHSQITLTSLLIERNSNNILNNGSCTEHSVTVSGNYAVAVFNRIKSGLEKIPVYSTVIFVELTTTEPDSSTPSTTPPEPSSDAVIGTLFAVLVFVIVTIVIGGCVFLLKRIPKKHFIEQPPYGESDPNYETVPLAARPPAYETVFLSNNTNQQASIPIDKDAPPLPPPCKPEDTIGPSQLALIQHGTDTTTTVKKPLKEKDYSIPAHGKAATNHKSAEVDSDKDNITSAVSYSVDSGVGPENNTYSEQISSIACSQQDQDLFTDCESVTKDSNLSITTQPKKAQDPVYQVQPESHDSHIVPVPAYDRTKSVMVKHATSYGPLAGNTVSEIGGIINKNWTKPKPGGLPDQAVDPPIVASSQSERDKVVPEAKHCERMPQAKSASPPPPPSAESLLSIIHPISDKWEELGKALGIDEDRLDAFSSEGHGQVRLHDMVHHYFGNVHVKHTWEEFVVALKKIGEYEYADKLEEFCGYSVSQPAESEGEPKTMVVPPNKSHDCDGPSSETLTKCTDKLGTKSQPYSNDTNFDSQVSFSLAEKESPGSGTMTSPNLNSYCNIEIGHGTSKEPRRASPQPAQESQEYTLTDEESATPQDGPLCSPLENVLSDACKSFSSPLAGDDVNIH